MFSKLVTLRMVFVALPLAMAAPAAAESFTTIDFPHSTATVALDINASGEIVGRGTRAGWMVLEHGFLRNRHGKLMSVDYPGANFTVAAGINDRGDIVGQYRLPTDALMSRRGFMLRRGRFTEIISAAPSSRMCSGIGPSGDAVGRYCSMLPCTSDSGLRAWLSVCERPVHNDRCSRRSGHQRVEDHASRKGPRRLFRRRRCETHASC